MNRPKSDISVLNIMKEKFLLDQFRPIQTFKTHVVVTLVVKFRWEIQKHYKIAQLLCVFPLRWVYCQSINHSTIEHLSNIKYDVVCRVDRYYYALNIYTTFCTSVKAIALISIEFWIRNFHIRSKKKKKKKRWYRELFHFKLPYYSPALRG